MLDDTKGGIIMSLWSSLTKGIKNTVKGVTQVFSGKNPFGSGGGFNSLLSGAAGDIQDFAEGYTGERMAKKNLEAQEKQWALQNDLNERQFAYQQQLNTEQQQREDTAMQRKVADLKAAGLNPVLAANGSGASSAPLSAPALKAPSAPHLDDYSAGVRGAVDQVLSLIGMKKSFAVQDAQIQKLQAERGEIIANTNKAREEAENVRIQNMYQGDILSGKVTSQDLDNQLKSGTLQTRIDLESSKLTISRKEELIKNMELMLGQADYNLKKIDYDIQKLVKEGKITENQILDKKLELLTTQCLTASLDYESKQWDVDWYHKKDIPVGFSGSWIGQLGMLIGSVLGSDQAQESVIVNWFASILNNSSTSGSSGFKYSKSEWKAAIKDATRRPVTSGGPLWRSRQVASGDYGVRRNF